MASRTLPDRTVARKRDPPAALSAGRDALPRVRAGKRATQWAAATLFLNPFGSVWGGSKTVLVGRRVPSPPETGTCKGMSWEVRMQVGRNLGKMRPHIAGHSLWHDGLRRAGTARPTTSLHMGNCKVFT